MSEIRIGRAFLLVLALALAAGVAAELPAMKRYLKIEQM